MLLFSHSLNSDKVQELDAARHELEVAHQRYLKALDKCFQHQEQRSYDEWGDQSEED
ncbi:hypothetical protein ACQQ2Q_22305 [Agrobacterium sp. ES01]|uniref:hypothetical protein n=1 Tax=Agrobacterium sp. ES01 TaxID=3420714 RepID=UPI003D12FD2A